MAEDKNQEVSAKTAYGPSGYTSWVLSLRTNFQPKNSIYQLLAFVKQIIHTILLISYHKYCNSHIDSSQSHKSFYCLDLYKYEGG